MSELVSVVVPIYNVEKYLDRCITSVVNQTYANLEIILVDDGSPDGCPQICDTWAQKDSRIRVIHKENAGLGMARNTGIDYATGEYICFFDSDDYVASETIEVCVSAANANKGDLVIFGHTNVTPEGQILGVHQPCPPKQMFVGEEITHMLLPMAISLDLKTGENWNLMQSACTKLYSMAVIRKSGWRFVSEREIISEDFYSLTELFGYLDRVCVLDRAFYYYTVNQASLSHSYKPDRFERIKTFYESMRSLSQRMQIANVLDQPIKAITFGFCIGAIKQIVASNQSVKVRYQEVRRIIQDDMLQKMVKGTDYSGTGIQKKLLYCAVKHKLVGICYLLACLKNKSGS